MDLHRTFGHSRWESSMGRTDTTQLMIPFTELALCTKPVGSVALSVCKVALRSSTSPASKNVHRMTAKQPPA